MPDPTAPRRPDLTPTAPPGGDARSERLRRFYATLARCYDAIARETDETALFEEICGLAVQLGSVKMAWIGFAQDATRRIVPVASSGDERGYLDGLVISTDPDDPRSRGATGTAFREGHPVWIEDFARDPRASPWLEKARASGWQGSGALPIHRQGRPVGTLTMYSTDPSSFDPEVRLVLADLAVAIGLALDRFAATAQLRLDSTAFESAANAIVVTDRNGTIERVNAAFSAMTGFAPAECAGRNFRDLVKSGQQGTPFYATLWRTILAGHVWRGTMVNRKKDGTLYTEASTITPVQDHAGQITHFVAVKQDVTEQRSLEEQFRQAQKMESVGRLAGGVAHDFNNMLSVILGRVELALMRLDEHSPVRADLLEVRGAAQRSADLTRQLLAFARKQTVSPRVLDLNVEVKNALMLLARLVSEDIVLEWRPAPSVWKVYVDPSQLDQILANLCVNARDAIKSAEAARTAPAASPDTVTISTADRVLDATFCAAHPDAVPGEYVQLSVRDTGSGMTREVLSRIFEPFFTTKGPGEGTGLGLATVFGAVRQNGGLILVQSAVGAGTTFEILLPRRDEPAAVEAVPPDQAPALGDETVLVVEDEQALLRLTSMTLRRLGYTVLSAANSSAAIALADAHPGPIDLLLTDLVMPGMNGRALGELLVAKRPELRRLYMSGYAADTLTGASDGVAAVELMQKPFSLTGLSRKVRDVLDRP